MSVFGAFFGCELFAAFELNIEVYRVSRRIHSEYGEIQAKPTPNEAVSTQLSQNTASLFLIPY